MADQFYSYLWLREDGTPYYAGKGYGKRAFVRGSHHCYPPKDLSRILIFPMTSEVEAFESEIALIELFGRKDNGTGCLRNMTDGGDGVAGYRFSVESKATMSRLAHNRKESVEWRDHISASLVGNTRALGYRHTPDTIEKIRLASLGNTHSSGWLKGKPRGKRIMETV